MTRPRLAVVISSLDRVSSLYSVLASAFGFLLLAYIESGCYHYLGFSSWKSCHRC